MYETLIFVMTSRQVQLHITNGAAIQYMSRLVGKRTMWFLTRSDTNRHLQSQKLEILDLERRGTVLSV